MRWLSPQEDSTILGGRFHDSFQQAKTEGANTLFIDVVLGPASTCQQTSASARPSVRALPGPNRLDSLAQGSEFTSNAWARIDVTRRSTLMAGDTLGETGFAFHRTAAAAWHTLAGSISICQWRLITRPAPPNMPA